VASEATGPNSASWSASTAMSLIAIGAIGDRDRQIDQDPSRIMSWPRPAHPVECPAQLGGQRRGVGQIGQQPRPGVRHDPRPHPRSQ
jgi:hypothetical protein